MAISKRVVEMQQHPKITFPSTFYYSQPSTTWANEEQIKSSHKITGKRMKTSPTRRYALFSRCHTIEFSTHLCFVVSGRIWRVQEGFWITTRGKKVCTNPLTIQYPSQANLCRVIEFEGCPNERELLHHQQVLLLPR